MKPLLDIKQDADEKVLINTKLLDNESYFEKLLMQLVIKGFGKTSIDLEPDSATYINNCLVKEYVNEYQGISTW
jgi:type I restriction enzyme R subunit